MVNWYDDREGEGAVYDQYRRAPFIWGDVSKTWLNPYSDSPILTTQTPY